jgi:hypothetical protein
MARLSWKPFHSWPSGPRLYLLAALAAAFLLVPIASASAANPPASVVFEGSGSGWVKGEGELAGNPPLECHWNGTEIDIGMKAGPPIVVGEPPYENEKIEEPGICKTEIVSGESFKGQLFHAEEDPGSKFVEWGLISADLPIGCEELTAPYCGIVTFVNPIEVKATFGPVPGITLTINGTGAGTGQVNCVVNEGERTDEPCEAQYEKGTKLELIAAPGKHSEFVGFENGTHDAESCTISPCGPFMLENEAGSELDARFDLIPHTLTVEASGEGSVSADSGEVSGCEEGGGTCSGSYPENETVTLTATPGEHKVVEWEGCAPVGGEPKCKVVIPESDATVKAKFVAAPQGTLTVEASGEGSVSAVPPPEPVSGGISACEEAECSAVYYQGDTVTLAAAPGTHQQVAWTGCTPVGGEPNECKVEVDSAAVSVEAAFTTITHTLTIAKAGTGSGTVECNINGGGFGSCAGPIDEGSSVEVKATPAAHSTFDGLSAGTGSAGGCEAEGSPCSFTLEEDSALTATFTQVTHTLTVEVESPGSVSGGPISGCVEGGGTCSGSAGEGSTVTLTATPAAHAHFVEWTGSGAGACGGESTPTCEVEVSEDKTVKAVFAYNEHTLTVVPTGEGEVSGGPISGCGEGGGTCSGAVLEGTTVTLTAAPGAHKETVWTSGCDSEPSANECEVEIPAGDATVEVEFVQTTHTLGVVLAGTGSGTVECNINGGGFGSCAGPIDEGSSVEVKATPAAHSTFDGFSAGTGSAGGCEAEGSPCSFTLEEDSALTATFTQVTHTLTINNAGTGAGSVSCDGGACASSFPEGTEATLAAIAASGSTFTGWSGGGCSGTGACVVTLNADTTVTATFNANPPPTCETDPSLCPPEEAGTAKAAGTAQVKGNKAALKLTCTGGGACKGSLKLTAKVKQGRKKNNNEVIGKASFSIATGKSKTIKIKITNGQVRKDLAKGQTVKAKLKGSGIKPRTVKLKSAKTKTKRHHKRGRERWALMHGGRAVSNGKTTVHRQQATLNYLRKGRYVLHVYGPKGGTRIVVR